MNIRAAIRDLERIAPPDLADPMDEGRIGLIIEGREEIERIGCALDATPAVAESAVLSSIDLLVVHHTPLFTPTTSVRGFLARAVRPLLTGGINLYVMHTNFDRARGGINDTLAGLLGLRNVEPLSMGCIGDATLPLAEMVRRLEGGVRIWGKVDRIRKLAVAGGSGFDPVLLEEAAERGADAFLSAELRHHVAIASPLPCIESTHHALEAPGMRALARRMNWEFIDESPSIRYQE
ncbi:MAG: Nif3-like dinuclear metal center hexameric protein [Methanomicrobiales archaeon]|nr:Nif3-like dinuclear metal center hexameric protein [Methanomicrobiales archaeon]MDI6877197.1 Nif3-like dinuclear metal center hexameric protein [Methanomicrobiales archaeon]